MIDTFKEHFAFAFFCILLIYLIAIFAVYRAVESNESKWEQTVKEKNCKIVGYFETSRISATGWLCDDGITYYR